MKELQELMENLRNSLSSGEYAKMTLSKPNDKKSDLQNIYIRLILIKNIPQISFTYHYKTNDKTKNMLIEEAVSEIESLLQNSFSIATLFTSNGDFTLKISTNNTATLLKQKPSFTNAGPLTHDRPKIKRAETDKNYLTFLGVTDKEGNLIPKMADKYKQINKYLEIIESLIKSVSLPEKVNIVDMGSGKGYLTFALYDYLKNKLSLNVTITGIELRQELVEYCNNVAIECGFNSLHFICKPIEEYKEVKIDMLIALHACDTATDDAIYKGIVSNSTLIICAPCCHKQLRQQVKGLEQESPLLKYGIFKERQFEMVTDTIRALIMEEHQYQTKIFEFISNEHTRKNILLVGAKTEQKADKKNIGKKIESIKNQYQIKQHYLEKLVNVNS
jgi:hypothetical protein